MSGPARFKLRYLDGPFVDGDPYEAWAEMHNALAVHRNIDGEQPLDVYAYAEDGLVHLVQGGERIVIPFDELGAFSDEVERLYTGGLLEHASAQGPDGG